MQIKVILLLLCAGAAFASVFGGLRGLVHDPQHRPITGAQVTIRAAHSDWHRSVTSDSDGQFTLTAVPAGQYVVEVHAPGFAVQKQNATVLSDTTRELHFPMAVEAVFASVEVSDVNEGPQTASAASTTLVARDDISHTPGALSANSLAMVTDFVPSAVVTHDQLHIRGGHQYTWLLDGIPVPNTNIASSVGPQFDPKDIDYLEVARGGLNAEYGDRAYGVLNVVTRSGFERNREGELVASYGSFHQTDDQLNFGSHSERFAWYTSLSGNRSDLGLETPSPEVLHDIGSGLSGFASLIFNRTPQDQLRSVISVRGDHYQVPNTPPQQADGIRDIDHERDVFATASWTHTSPAGLLFTVAPFYHFNAAHYQGSGPSTTAVIPDDDRGSHYAGGVATLGITRGKHSARAGLQGFVARDQRTLSLTGAGLAPFQHTQHAVGSIVSLFAEEQYKLASWMQFSAGVRYTRFSGALVEDSVDPRLGAALTIPRLKWTLHASYSRYYQAPPLFSVTGPIETLAAQQGFGFLPLRGEKDEQHEVGVSIPLFGWRADFSEFRTTARNFFDHDALGNSNIFFPLTIERARIHGWEATVSSRQIARRARVHLAYSRQWVQGRGGVTGGLTDFTAPDPGYYYLDHDQRDTLSTGAELTLPHRTWASFNVAYGSGFLNGDGPAHLPSHTTADISLGHSFGERWTVQASALNVGNRRYLLDNSNTLGGTHYANPREFLVRVNYRFKF
jgi:outer membrane receptor protein involved in Fe transport